MAIIWRLIDVSLPLPIRCRLTMVNNLLWLMLIQRNEVTITKKLIFHLNRHFYLIKITSTKKWLFHNLSLLERRSSRFLQVCLLRSSSGWLAPGIIYTMYRISPTILIIKRFSKTLQINVKRGWSSGEVQYEKKLLTLCSTITTVSSICTSREVASIYLPV